jgi:hypothetical protein
MTMTPEQREGIESLRAKIEAGTYRIDFAAWLNARITELVGAHPPTTPTSATPREESSPS